MTTKTISTKTKVVITVALFLSLPISIATLALNGNHVPQFILRTTTINTVPGKTITLKFGLLTSPNDAICAGATISMISTALFGIAILMRHFTIHQSWQWLALGASSSNLLGQVACSAAVFILKAKYPVANSRNDITYKDGMYDTSGKLYTREAWACSMDALYAHRESNWAGKACYNFKAADILMLPLLVCAAILLGIAIWQVREYHKLGRLSYQKRGDGTEFKKRTNNRYNKV
ncbi:hypothetical protein GQ44DRAFT_619639 [Phaeosphaeriaceae sp. PMI808]|nr:hypothetical protein GQ44DRAFT_619639 [Phaeosphaeriaceae sp. PMI808]